MIWIIGGTAETKEFLERIPDNLEYLVTVATESGKSLLPHAKVQVGRMDYGEMLEFIDQHDISICVDLSHPYATEVSAFARKAAEETGITYFRYVRGKTETEQAIHFSSLTECLQFLTTIHGTVFFTTGSKNIRDFQKVRGDNRFIYRILPAMFSLQACLDHQVAVEDIIAIMGPCSQELNAAMFAEYGASFVVMKDSGIKGGTPQKIAACKSLGITPLVIGREEEEGEGNLEELAIKVVDICVRKA